jgi:3-oxoacyl-[acyl-carrier-protein] synthase-3
MATLRHSFIAGVGHYVPSRVVKNAELEPMMNTSDAWIQERTGIQERRWFEEGKDTTANMGANAARQALAMAGVAPDDVQLIVFATLSPDYFFPGSGVLLQRELGMTNNAPALDVRNQSRPIRAHRHVRYGAGGGLRNSFLRPRQVAGRPWGVGHLWRRRRGRGAAA